MTGRGGIVSRMTTLENARTTESCADAVFAGILGMEQTTALYLGDRLGWYRSLADDGAATAPELAARTGTAARYAREWLEYQAVCGLLTVDDPAAAPDDRRFALPDAHVPVLADPDSESVLTPFARILVASLRRIDDLLEAYRTGGGVSWEQLGEDAREGQAAQNRPLLRDALSPAPTRPARRARHARLRGHRHGHAPQHPRVLRPRRRVRGGRGARRAGPRHLPLLPAQLTGDDAAAVDDHLA
jgi:hypothetical protein